MCLQLLKQRVHDKLYGAVRRVSSTHWTRAFSLLVIRRQIKKQWSESASFYPSKVVKRKVFLNSAITGSWVMIGKANCKKLEIPSQAIVLFRNSKSSHRSLFSWTGFLDQNRAYESDLSNSMNKGGIFGAEQKKDEVEEISPFDYTVQQPECPIFPVWSLCYCSPRTFCVFLIMYGTNTQLVYLTALTSIMFFCCLDILPL